MPAGSDGWTLRVNEGGGGRALSASGWGMRDGLSFASIVSLSPLSAATRLFSAREFRFGVREKPAEATANERHPSQLDGLL
ncbi:uncharacterized protein UV8b_04721 [Ustilaginoidea virens]|uniref:Uncharacterized protein n=1 Tax=Ustilaginoidea virens TaxID=1159556 RepID=A0A8E5HRU2_USTVR|nr:uncharacterized protein UV8b_04721 [Ustilaginoidea virens]QUC20480.1 hypothetical protein UV8b_04721 [Ustilaginoidea virens]